MSNETKPVRRFFAQVNARGDSPECVLASDYDALRAALDEREAELARLKQWLLGESAHIVDQWDAGYDAAIRAMLRQLGATS